jgi:putative hydrolase
MPGLQDPGRRRLGVSAATELARSPGETSALPDLTRNRLVADRLREAAGILEEQQANPFRVRAYRRAADTMAGLEEDLRAIVQREGVKGLTALPGVGEGIAAAIDEMLRTGRWGQLERLRGTLDPEKLFQTVPGIGPTLARRLHEALEIDTLAALEVAAHDGRVASVRGVGARRAAMIRAQLAAILGRVRAGPRAPAAEPPVETLLDVDDEYRRKAAAGRLPRIAPRRFNPAAEAWLPVLHTERGDWHFTALFSNTAQAHRLGRTRDWVVVYFHTDHEPEGQRTVVTETRGPRAGTRVVRGREDEGPLATAADLG